VLLLALDPLSGSFLPKVEDPWPDRIGMGLPFTLAGGGAVLAGILFAGSTAARRDRAIMWGGVFGFLGGVCFYAISLVVQVTSR
jgi:hypothetical protein